MSKASDYTEVQSVPAQPLSDAEARVVQHLVEHGTSARTAWLIESPWCTPPAWLRLWGTFGEPAKPEWTSDAYMALAFSRREDALWFATLFPAFCCCAQVTEHVFVDRVPAS